MSADLWHFVFSSDCCEANLFIEESQVGVEADIGWGGFICFRHGRFSVLIAEVRAVVLGLGRGRRKSWELL